MLPHYVRLLKIAVLMLLLCTSTYLQASNHHWKSKIYSHYSNSDSLTNFIEKMSSSIGVSSIISDKISGSFSGNIEKSSIIEILDLLNHVYSVVWYYDGTTLYFYNANEISMSLLDLGGADPDFIKQMLTEAGIWDNRFTWKPVNSYSAVYVSGPARLKTLIEELIILVNHKKNETDKLQREAVVVPLRYVKAADETVNLGGESQQVVGLVTTLRELVYDQKATEIEGSKIADGSGKDKNQLKSQLKSQITSGIKAHANQNAIVLLDSAENVKIYRDLIRKLDIPSDQVEIDVTIIDVSIDRVHELGFDWESFGSNGTLNLSEGLSASLTSSATLIDGATNPITTAEDLFRLNINALASDGEANILSQPSVVTMNNIPASIDNSETFFIRLQGNEEVGLEQITVGSVLKVTPRILDAGEDKEIHLDVYLEDGQRTGGAVDGLPIIKRTKIKTKSVVRSHGSLLIGGYYVERSETGNVGVPIIKDIPFIGRAFRKEVTQKEKLTRLFLLTPKIVSKRSKEHRNDENEVISYIKQSKDHTLNRPLQPARLTTPNSMIFD